MTEDKKLADKMVREDFEAVLRRLARSDVPAEAVSYERILEDGGCALPDHGDGGGAFVPFTIGGRAGRPTGLPTATMTGCWHERARYGRGY
jgi:hypothetical protein